MSALIDTAKIAQLLGVTREHVTDRLTKRPDFPRPAVNLSRRLRRWSEADVRAWLATQSKRAAMSEADSR
jgi:predicted DNA-binding transcriptional regulator AlpA